MLTSTNDAFFFSELIGIREGIFQIDTKSVRFLLILSDIKKITIIKVLPPFSDILNKKLTASELCDIYF